MYRWNIPSFINENIYNIMVFSEIFCFRYIEKRRKESRLQKGAKMIMIDSIEMIYLTQKIDFIFKLIMEAMF